MPLGNLPESAKKIWEKVFDQTKNSGADDEKSAKIAWGAVRNAGWEKDESGEWKKKSLTEFSLNVKKAALDNGVMKWRADTSDTEADLADDNMTLALFEDFIQRIEADEPAPEQFRSEFWSGGNPYVSVSHYPDMNGDAVPGCVDAVYIDGKFLKARGRFHDNPLGRRCFESLQNDLQQIKATSRWHDGRVRVSIAFLDWMHRHKSSGFVFERKTLDDVCPECLAEIISGKKLSGKAFLKGQLVHLALTRVPMNTRTIMEVDKAMTTRKEDAASIIGEDLAEELEEKATKAVKKAALVEFSDTEESHKPVVEESATAKEAAEEEDEEQEEGEMTGKEKKKVKKDEKEEGEYKALLFAVSELSSKVDSILSAKSSVVVEHPLDGAVSVLKMSYDGILKSDATPEDKLKMLQPAFDEFADTLIRGIKPEKSGVVESNGGTANDLVQALSQVMQPLAEKLDLISTKLESRSTVPQAAPNIPERRSINPALLQSVQQKSASVTPKLREIIERTTQ